MRADGSGQSWLTDGIRSDVVTRRHEAGVLPESRLGGLHRPRRRRAVAFSGAFHASALGLPRRTHPARALGASPPDCAPSDSASGLDTGPGGGLPLRQPRPPLGISPLICHDCLESRRSGIRGKRSSSMAARARSRVTARRARFAIALCGAAVLLLGLVDAGAARPGAAKPAAAHPGRGCSVRVTSTGHARARGPCATARPGAAVRCPASTALDAPACRLTTTAAPASKAPRSMG